MPLAYLLDENLRGSLWRAAQQQNSSSGFPIDVVRVGDPPDLPLGTLDDALLAWAEREGRILVSFDRRTLVAQLADHLQAGRRSPGIFLIRPRRSLQDVLTHLVLAAYASDPSEWQDRAVYIPC